GFSLRSTDGPPGAAILIGGTIPHGPTDDYDRHGQRGSGEERWYSMSRRATALAAMLAVVTLASAACTSTKPPGTSGPGGADTSPAAIPDSKFFVRADFDRQ